MPAWVSKRKFNALKTNMEINKNLITSVLKNATPFAVKFILFVLCVFDFALCADKQCFNISLYIKLMAKFY